MRKLYSFSLSKAIEVEETQIQKNDKGEEIKVLVKTKKSEKHDYFIKKPGRALTEESELYYNSIYWDAVKRGIMPASQLQKRLLNDGGVLSEEQKKEYDRLYEELFKKQATHNQLKEKTEKTEEETKEMTKVFGEIVEIISSLQSFETNTQNQLYQNTAENLARNRCALWWTLHLSYEQVGDKEIPIFGAGDYSAKLKVYDLMEEKEDKYEFELIQKLLLACSLYYFGKAETQEDFDMLLKVSENKNLIEAVDTINKANEKTDKETKKPADVNEKIKKEMGKEEVILDKAEEKKV